MGTKKDTLLSVRLSEINKVGTFCTFSACERHIPISDRYYLFVFQCYKVLIKYMLLLILLYVVGVSVSVSANAVPVGWTSCNCVFFFLSILFPVVVSNYYIPIDILAYLVAVICSR